MDMPHPSAAVSGSRSARFLFATSALSVLLATSAGNAAAAGENTAHKAANTPAQPGNAIPLAQAPGLARYFEQVYGHAYDAKQACWPTRVEDSDTCMKVDSLRRVTAGGEDRYYAVLTGSPPSEESGHVTPGFVGAFVLRVTDGAPEPLAAIKADSQGSFGNPPTKWRLAAIGPGGYLGWINSAGYTAQGYTTSQYIILAPYGKGIGNLAQAVDEGYSNGGACDDNDPACKETDVDTQLQIDDSDPNVRVYPLKITVDTRVKGQAPVHAVYTLPFDMKKWAWTTPADWPFNKLDR